MKEEWYQKEVANLIAVLESGKETLGPKIHREYVLEKLYRIIERTGIGVHPSLNVKIEEILKTNQKIQKHLGKKTTNFSKILIFLLENDMEFYSIYDLISNLDIKHSTIHGHIKEMEEKNLILKIKEFNPENKLKKPLFFYMINIKNKHIQLIKNGGN